MAIHEPGHDQVSRGIDHFGRSIAGQNFIIRADGYDAVRLDDHSAVAEDCAVLVHGQNYAVPDDDIIHPCPSFEFEPII
ncbi:hypothetical protein [Paenibacillus illinoisensis]|uniref:hypothetical protein n=1 Tax=Paenibacillus illinoisensis TaxID=59845 RepID=UPI00301BCDAB